MRSLVLIMLLLLPHLVLCQSGDVEAHNTKENVLNQVHQLVEAIVKADQKFIEDVFAFNVSITVDNGQFEPSDFLNMITAGAVSTHQPAFGQVVNLTSSDRSAWAKITIARPEDKELETYSIHLGLREAGWKIISLHQSVGSNINGDRILFVLSNAHNYGDSQMNASNHFAEICLPYDELVSAGYTVDFVSPEGGAVPLGYITTNSQTIKSYLYDSDFMFQLEHTRKPEEVNPDDYRAIYFSGGGAAMFGVHDNVAIQNLAISIYNSRGIVSAVCHGTAGIVEIKNSEGEYLVDGKVINGFPDLFENKEADYYQTFPFSIEEAIQNHGGKFEYSEEGWDAFYRVDGRIITGQDPTSARPVAKAIVARLKEQDQ